MDQIPDKKRMCHLTGFTKSCRDLVMDEACQNRWVNVIGQNPQTLEKFNMWGCVDDQTTMLQMRIEHRLMGVQAAVESRGNEMIKMQTEVIVRQDRAHKLALGHSEERSTPPMQLTHAPHVEDGQMDLIDHIASKTANGAH